MADKGFRIEKEIEAVGLQLNIKIGKHRVHVVCVISRIKQFKILSGKISLSFFKLLIKYG